MISEKQWRYIKPPKGIAEKSKEVYVTSDIIAEILKADKTAYKDVQEFARRLKFNNLRDLSKQLFDFLYSTIKYVEDPSGWQKVKFPAALWSQKNGDCKSFSLFIGSVLKALGIPYSYRFASYRSNHVYTHVYPVAHGKDYDVIIDVVYKKFDQEKEYTHKKDFKMAGLYSIKGIGENPSGVLNIYKDLSEMSDADMELAIAKQRLEIERNIVAGLKGIGSAKVAEYDKAIDTINEFIGAIVNEDDAAVGAIIGKTKGKAKTFLKKVATKTTTAVKTAAKKTGTAVKTAAKKTGQVVKKAAVITAKVVTAPTRLLMKGILEVTMPSAAPAFLYLFIEDPKIVAKLPEKARKKRDRQIKFANFVVNGIGMKRNHFMGILRNGIMKRYGMSPEKKIAEMMKGRISGIGSVAVIATVLTAVKKIVDFIKKIKPNSNVESLDESDMPEDSDFGDLTAAEQAAMAKETSSQKYAVEPGESLNDEYGVDESGGRRVKNICGF